MDPVARIRSSKILRTTLVEIILDMDENPPDTKCHLQAAFPALLTVLF